MRDAIERALEGALTGRLAIGEVLIRKADPGDFVLSHRDDETQTDLQTSREAEDAIGIASYDDAGNYRPLKTAPNLRHGWRLEVATLGEVRRAIDCIYPGRLAIFAVWAANRLATTPLRETLDRQSGMYRIAAKISDAQLNDMIGDFCRSDGGCLRTILWRRDTNGTVSSTKLPSEKFDPSINQAGRPRSETGATGAHAAIIPLLCQEACGLLVGECRKVVKMQGDALSAP